MTAPTIWYTHGVDAALRSILNLTPVTGTPKIMLLKATYVLDQDAHAFVNDISANEATGTGYSAGGIALASLATIVDAPTNTSAFDAADITGLSVSCCYAVVYVDTGTPATSPLLTITDFSEGGAVDAILTGITWNSSGIAALSAA